MLHNPSINLPIFLTYPLPNISTIIYSKLHEKYHICIFIPKTRQRRSLKEIITLMTLVIFYPKMKKEEKQNIYSTVVKFIFFYCRLAGQPASPRCWPTRATGYAGRADAGWKGESTLRFLPTGRRLARAARPAFPSLSDDLGRNKWWPTIKFLHNEVILEILSFVLFLGRVVHEVFVNSPKWRTPRKSSLISVSI